MHFVRTNEIHLSFKNSEKLRTQALKGSTTVPIKGVADKRQITATFTVSVTGAFCQSSWFIKAQLKGVYPSTSFQKSSVLRIWKTNGRISKNALIYLKKLCCHIYERKRLSLDIRKNKFHLSLWIPLRAKTTKRSNLFAWKIIAS